MGIANIEALVTKRAEIVEAIRWREASLANINPNYKDNQAYVAKLKAEVDALKKELASIDSQLQSTRVPTTTTPQAPPTA